MTSCKNQWAKIFALTLAWCFCAVHCATYPPSVLETGKVKNEVQCKFLAPDQDQGRKCRIPREDNRDPDEYKTIQEEDPDAVQWRDYTGVDTGCVWGGGVDSSSPDRDEEFSQDCKDICSGIHFYSREPDGKNCVARKLNCTVIDYEAYLNCVLVSVKEVTPEELRFYLPPRYTTAGLINNDNTSNIRTREQCKFYCPTQLGHGKDAFCKDRPDDDSPRNPENHCEISGFPGSGLKKYSYPNRKIENACIIQSFKGDQAKKNCDDLCAGRYYARSLETQPGVKEICYPGKLVCKPEEAPKAVGGYYCVLLAFESTESIKVPR